MVHGKTVKDAKRKARESLEAKIRKVYAEPQSLLRRYPAVHEGSLAARPRQSSGWLILWLRHLDQQQWVTQLERARGRAWFGSIKRFMRKQDEID
jgi:hypothetical protein